MTWHGGGGAVHTVSETEIPLTPEPKWVTPITQALTVPFNAESGNFYGFVTPPIPVTCGLKGMGINIDTGGKGRGYLVAFDVDNYYQPTDLAYISKPIDLSKDGLVQTDMRSTYGPQHESKRLLVGMACAIVDKPPTMHVHISAPSAAPAWPILVDPALTMLNRPFRENDTEFGPCMAAGFAPVIALQIGVI